MSGGLPEKFGERIAELDTLPGAEACQGCAMLEKEIAEAIRAASGRDRVVLDSLRRKLAVTSPFPSTPQLATVGTAYPQSRRVVSNPHLRARAAGRL
jgi:hypothetical protein